MLYSQLLEESELSESDMICIKALISQAEKLNFLIASLIKASRLEADVISVFPKLQRVEPLLNNVLEQIDTKAKHKSIKISCCKTQDTAIFDLKWTSEAVYNIIDNAVKYTPSGGTISVSVILYQFFCRIDICDTGIGISEDDLAKIFTRFYRSHEVSDADGIGIGLYLARKIIQSEGGYIKVNSKLNSGSTFSVFLPL